MTKITKSNNFNFSHFFSRAQLSIAFILNAESYTRGKTTDQTGQREKDVKMVVLHKWPAFLKKQKAKKRIAITATAIPKNIEQMKGYFLEKLWCCTSGEVTH